MAEIHVQTKKHPHSSPLWIWILIGLLIAAAVIYLVSTRNAGAEQQNKTNQNNTISRVESPAAFNLAAFQLNA